MSADLLQDFPHAQRLSTSLGTDVERALAEDVGSGDISAHLIDPGQQAVARVISRESGIFCGAPWVTEICRQSPGTVDVAWRTGDGRAIASDDELFTLAGSARALLTLERTVLNFIALLSGTATTTHRYVKLMGEHPAKLLDTRKTIPGLRMAQKYAVFCGGGHNHRLGLFDAYLLKENHIAAAGGITQAVSAAKANAPGRSVEVEVESLEELDEAITAGADMVMLDNFSLADTRAAVARTAGTVPLEASGNITEHNITEIARTGVDYISSGIITKQIVPLDLSMRFV